MTMSLRGLSILYVVSEDFYFCTHRLRLAEYAIKRGARVSLVTNLSDKQEAILKSGIRIIENPLNRSSLKLWKDVFYIMRLAFIYYNTKPTITHHVALKPCLYGSLAAKVTHPHLCINAIAGLGGSLNNRSILSNCLSRSIAIAFHALFSGNHHKVITQNDSDMKFLTDRCSLEPSQVALIRGAGVDLENYAPTDEPSDETIVISIVCRMLKPKGVLDLIEASRILGKAGYNFRIRLVGAPDPANKQSLSEHDLLEISKSENIQWDGPRDDIALVWRESHIAVLPTWYGEGIPKCLIEAASCARPIVTTNIAGCRDIVKDGYNGFLIPPHDAEELSKKLAKLITNKALREELGHNGRIRVEKHFSEAIVFEKTSKLYELARKPATTV